ncbi:MAG: cation diffusion facilitator family transporter [bacterium]|nr:cation diffusion facilitator family transporter [bacterium]
MEEHQKDQSDALKSKTILKVSAISIAVNLFLTVFKFLAGWLANSSAMISDAIHSASDVFSTFIVIAGDRIGRKKSDLDHQYGHERMECAAAIVLAVLLIITGINIGKNGFKNLTDPKALTIPGQLALIAALVSIATKEWMFWYARGAAKKIHSTSLMADAWHHRSDSLSSIGALLGIWGARLGYPYLDPLAAIIIALLIIKASIDIFKDAINKLVDKACDEETSQKINDLIKAQEGVLRVDDIKTRLFGNHIYADIEIAADGDLTLRASHEIAEKVHDAVEKNFPDVLHCAVHVNPFSE